MPVVSTSERVIPRPSERAAANRITVGRRSASPLTIEPTNGPRLDQDETTWRVVGMVALVAAALLFGVLGLLERADTVSGLLLVPGIAVVAGAALRRWVEPSAGRGAVAILLAGLGLRMLAAVPRLLGGVDAVDYQREGERIARSLRAFEFSVEAGRAVPGTGAVRWLSGFINLFTGSTYVATYLVFAVLAFVGQVLFVMAVRSSLSTRQFRLLLVAMMAWPALTFWPSSIGKESVVLFGLGLTMQGANRVYRRHASGALHLLAGLFAVGMVRPHVALIILSALVVGLLARHERGRSRILAHLAVVAVVAIGATWLSSASADLFGLEGIDGIEDIGVALDFTQNRTSQDLSQFSVVRVNSPADYPVAAVTVLVRPFPWEATNVMAFLSALEGAVLAGLLVAAIPGLLTERRRLLSNGVLLHAVAFTSVFIFLFSAIGNFGILSRQRAQVLPFVLVLVALGIGAQRRGLSNGEEAA